VVDKDSAQDGAAGRDLAQTIEDALELASEALDGMGARLVDEAADLAPIVVMGIAPPLRRDPDAVRGSPRSHKVGSLYWASPTRKRGRVGASCGR
jgi:hypothetical protein